MYSLHTFFTNYYLMAPLFGWIVAQAIKTVIRLFFRKEESFSLRKIFFGRGGMPSAHCTAFSALSTAVAVREGFGSPLFAVTAVLCVVVIIDAVQAGKQSQTLDKILERLRNASHGEKEERWQELMGHTPLQVFVGWVVGIVTALLVQFAPAFS